MLELILFRISFQLYAQLEGWDMFSMFAGWKQMNVSKFIIFNHELYINRLGSIISQSNSFDDDKFQRSILKMRFGNNLKTILDLFSYFYIWFFYIQLFVLRSLILSWKLVQSLVQNRTYQQKNKFKWKYGLVNIIFW